jgi:hypothetical protein
MAHQWGGTLILKVLLESVEWIERLNVRKGGVDPRAEFIPNFPGVTGLTSWGILVWPVPACCGFSQGVHHQGVGLALGLLLFQSSAVLAFRALSSCNWDFHPRPICCTSITGAGAFRGKLSCCSGDLTRGVGEPDCLCVVSVDPVVCFK